MPMMLLIIEDASFLLTTVVMATVRAVGMKPLMRRSKATLLVFVDGRSQHKREFQVLANVDSSTGCVVLMRFKQALLVS